MTAVSLPMPGLRDVPSASTPARRADFVADQEVRWCPGCGDYAILAAVQSFLPELGVRRENVVIISGIGCSSRFPYYLDVYGMHSIHGRAPAIATGLAVTRPDLSVWVVTGDGDALSIGGNHLIHALRRNVNLNILLFNNRIYGLTKGQYSPTSDVGTVTKSTPYGSVDRPFDPVSLALGAEATFVARSLDSDRRHLTGVLHAAARHRGTALVEIYQNCPVFNDGAFDQLRTAGDGVIALDSGRPVRFGPDRRHAVVRDRASGRLRIATDLTDPHVDTAPDGSPVYVHDPAEEDPTTAFALARLTGPAAPGPIGVFRSVDRPVYDDQVRAQRRAAAANRPTRSLAEVIAGTDTWRVGRSV